MKLLLVQDIRGLGKKGTEVSVKKGYATNFLIPQKLALPLTSQNRTQIEGVQTRAEKQKGKERREVVATLKQLQEQSYTVQVKSNDQGRLFKAVSEADVLAAVTSRGRHTVTGLKARFDSPIKEKGTYSVPVSLPGEVSGTITVKVL